MSSATAAVKLPPTSSDVAGASAFRIGVIHTEWNEAVISALLTGVLDELKRQGVPDANVTILKVPGAFELPFAASRLAAVARSKGSYFNAIITLGCLIKGDTMHFEYICEAVSRGIMDLNLDRELDTPVIFGVLAVLNEEQARVRAGLGPGSHNHGTEWAATALKMAALRIDVEGATTTSRRDNRQPAVAVTFAPTL